MIRVESVCKSFRTRSSPKREAGRKSAVSKITIDAVRDVSFECKPGRVFALLGPNGAGKTTLLRILATLLTPGTGRVWVDGIDAVACPEAARARSGFLTGSSGLYDRLSGRETLRYFGSLNGMDRDEILRRTAELAQSLGFESYLDRRVGRYSTGMKQKLSIARTVLHDPQVILFDEPTSGLDVIGAKAIMDWIRRSRDQGKTVLFSTHRMDEVALIAQDLAIIHEGSLCYNGTLDGFMQSYPGRSLEQAFSTRWPQPQDWRTHHEVAADHIPEGLDGYTEGSQGADRFGAYAHSAFSLAYADFGWCSDEVAGDRQ